VDIGGKELGDGLLIAKDGIGSTVLISNVVGVAARGRWWVRKKLCEDKKEKNITHYTTSNYF
jgi:hypothetical protein